MIDGKDFIKEMFELASTRHFASVIFKGAGKEEKKDRLDNIVENKEKSKLAKGIKYGGGSDFDSIVFILISKAQSTPDNYYRLCMGFPDYVEMWEEWQATKNEEDFFNKYGVK